MSDAVCIITGQAENDQINVLFFCRVMAQVSCELVAPKESRPNEGILFFNIELSPMASPAFEAGRWKKHLKSLRVYMSY